MLFSVVIPSHKRKELLKKLLHSLEQQGLEHSAFEVLVVATEADEAFELESRPWPFPIRFLFVPNDPTRGRSASIKRNFGAQKAHADWLAFVDDDCITDPNWLLEAQNQIQKQNPHFMEGAVHIPEPAKKTFTYKGIQRLSRPGGFQTCNMFYKREDFLALGGFDPNFPYYLEDTDLGWTFKEAGKKYFFLEKSIVSHPVPPGAPHKMLESAFRMEKLPYLYKKHPQTFKASKMRALPRPFFILTGIDLGLILSILFFQQAFLTFLVLKLCISLALLFRMMRGCSTHPSELLSMYYYLLICPSISLIWLMRGNLKHQTWLFIR